MCSLRTVPILCFLLWADAAANAGPAPSPSPRQMLQVPMSQIGPGVSLSRKVPEARYPWKTDIVTTVFWIGERPTRNNTTPNRSSSWDAQWSRNFGGADDPKRRKGWLPAGFTPGQNPFYIALPYNDRMSCGFKPEASKVIPWFDGNRAGESQCHGRWVAVRRGLSIAYAQWEDCGPFRTDHWQYVFGPERPKENLNQGAGLDVSPAVRDFLGMNGTDVTDWRFVDVSEVPPGPWRTIGENNPFVQAARNVVRTARR